MEPQTILSILSITLLIGGLLSRDKQDRHTALIMSTVLAVGTVILNHMTQG